MIGLLQRVSLARVVVDAEVVAEIGSGLLVLVGVERGDDEARAERLLERILNYRVFSDADERMNLSLRDTAGGLLLVPQFTLAADTRKGNRPGFSSAAKPDDGQCLFNHVYACAREQHAGVEKGIFGADMQVSLTNDGPVTFWLQC
ncbi:MAG: D-tyrosyl-tRNA(Tyr) deacylase [Gammaproteobacteria bacterium]|nr:D-tyrosyl-tRNA(Tyr) deacylase [Gammaproteobacteria bacterium]